jgi:3-oxoacid CoA-transferase subunit A
MLDKTIGTADDAVVDVSDGASLSVGGFGLVGIPAVLIEAIRQRAPKNLTIISNNCGTDGFGLGTLLEDNLISRTIGSYIGSNRIYAQQYLDGTLSVEFTPQGTLAERMRAGGAGVPAFYTKAGVGTELATGGLPVRYSADGTPAELSEPKETRVFDGEEYILENAIRSDFGLVHAHMADRQGNLVFRRTARNFNPEAAQCARVCIAQVEHLVDEIDPDEVHLPGIHVDRVVVVGPQETGIENRTVSTDEEKS